MALEAVSISAEQHSPDNFSVEFKLSDGRRLWVDCRDVEPLWAAPEPSCPGWSLEDVTFRVEGMTAGATAIEDDWQPFSPDEKLNTAIEVQCREALMVEFSTDGYEGMNVR